MKLETKMWVVGVPLTTVVGVVCEQLLRFVVGRGAAYFINLGIVLAGWLVVYQLKLRLIRCKQCDKYWRRGDVKRKYNNFRGEHFYTCPHCGRYNRA